MNVLRTQPVAFAGFPIHSGGTARDSHPLPYTRTDYVTPPYEKTGSLVKYAPWEKGASWRDQGAGANQRGRVPQVESWSWPARDTGTRHVSACRGMGGWNGRVISTDQGGRVKTRKGHVPGKEPVSAGSGCAGEIDMSRSWPTRGRAVKKPWLPWIGRMLEASPPLRRRKLAVAEGFHLAFPGAILGVQRV
jgi:hypothetical protein